MKNTLGDLNNHLFAQLERLGDEELKGDALELELKRSKAISDVSKNVIDNAKIVLDAHKFMDDRMDMESKLPKMLGDGNE